MCHSKDMEEVCIGQTIDRIVNITHQSARQTALLDYFTHAQTSLHSTPLYRKLKHIS